MDVGSLPLECASTVRLLFVHDGDCSVLVGTRLANEIFRVFRVSSMVQIPWLWYMKRRNTVDFEVKLIMRRSASLFTFSF